MNFTINYTKNDFENAIALYLKNNQLTNKFYRFLSYQMFTKRYLSLILGILLIAIGLYFLHYSPTTNNIIDLSTFFILWIFGFNFIFKPFSMRKTFFKYFNNTMQFSRPVNFNLNDNSLIIKSETEETNLDWKAIHKLEYDKNCLLLYKDQYLFYMIPSRIFSDSEYQKLISFIKERIKK